MSKPTVLIADDDCHVRMALRIRLSAMGYRVIEARTGLDVLREAPGHEVAAVILDYDMPDGDGQSIARFIRKESDVPIVLLTGYPREKFRKLVHCLPDVYFMPKPLEFERLKELLGSLTEQHASREAELCGAV